MRETDKIERAQRKQKANEEIQAQALKLNEKKTSEMDLKFNQYLDKERQAELQRQKEFADRKTQQENTVLQLITDFQNIEYDEARKMLEDHSWNYPLLKNDLNAKKNALNQQK